MPLCELKYESLPVEDYAYKVLKDKPATNDDFLNGLYRDISKRGRDGSE